MTVGAQADLPIRAARCALLRMRLQLAAPIVGARRPLLIERLVVASITVLLALQCFVVPASAGATRSATSTTVKAILAKACDGLLMPSESDYPFQPFIWPNGARSKLSISRLRRLTGHAPDTAVEIVGLDYFFRNVAQPQPWHDPTQAENVRKFKRLVKVLTDNLTDIRVYRVGSVQIDVYIVGRVGRDLVGLSTIVIET